MPSVEASVSVPGEVAEIERHWYRTERWPRWVDGLEEILEVSGGWPGAGSRVRWRSIPTGRGEVTEQVAEHAPGTGQTLLVTDATAEARQRVSFTPTDGGVEVGLSFAYRVTRRSPVTPLLELLFVSRAFRASLEATLHRFAAELAAQH